jgi:hypothetical protein
MERIEVVAVASQSSLMNIFYLAVWMEVVWLFFDHATVLFFITLFFSGLCILLMVLDLILQVSPKREPLVDVLPEA